MKQNSYATSHEEDFNTFQDFIKKYPLDQITVSVCIERAEDAGDYHLVQLALPMKNRVINCCIWKALDSDLTSYKNKALKTIKAALGE
jgi:hypothetical protein